MVSACCIRRTETVCLCVALVGCLLSTSPVQCPPASKQDNCQPRKQNKPAPEEECSPDLERSFSYYGKFKYDLNCTGASCDLRHDCGRAPLNTIRGNKLLPYIMYGQRQRYGNWPSFATVKIHYTHRVTKEKTVYRCGGVIISPWHILTAAHCVEGAKQAIRDIWKDLSVVVGDDTTDEYDPHQIEYAVWQICNAKLYDPKNNLHDDWAVLKLNDTIKFNKYIQPACLPYKPDYDPQPGQFLHCFMMGWGDTDFNIDYQIVATVIYDMPVAAQPCKIWADRTAFCAKKMNGHGTVCSGDSGSPVLCKNPRSNRWTVIGIVTRGTSDCLEGGVDWQFVAANVTRLLKDIKSECQV